MTLDFSFFGRKMKETLNICLIALIFHCCAPAALSGISGEKRDHRGAHEKSSKSYRPDLTVTGDVLLADGLGKQSIDLIETLRDSLTISFLPTRPVSVEDLNSCSPALRQILETSGVKFPGRVLIYESMLSWMPSNEIPRDKFWTRFNVPEKSKHQIRIAYTMFESSRAPKAWVYILNHSFDAVVVPDDFLVKVYKDSGLVIPIFVIPLGRDLRRFLEAPLKAARGSPMVFANYSTCFPRKNLLTLVRAFGDAFGNSSDVQLQLCWRGYDHLAREAILAEIASRGLTNVVIEQQGVDVRTYLERFRRADCYVNIATGEGFSIQPREAMALGIPTIVSNNTGQKTICSSGLVRAVPSNIEIPAMYTFPGDFGVQYQCAVQDVAAALRDVYASYDSYLRKGGVAREWARRYHYTQMAPLYMSLIKPKRVVLGDKDAILEDGIMTKSKKLVRKYKKVMKIP